MDPVAVSVKDAGTALGGLGLTKTYELIGSGKLQTAKIGRRTVVMTDSIRRFAAELADA